MPKYRVEELEVALLDAAVAKAEGLDFVLLSDCLLPARMRTGDGRFRPSVLWDEGGPIIERERISLTERGADGWFADLRGVSPIMGSTPLIAAMRAYVASKFGQEVELP